MTIGMPCLSVVSVEDDLAATGTGAGGQTLCDNLGGGQGLLVEDGMEQLVELLGLAAHDGGLLVDLALVEQVDGDLHHGSTGALAVTRLEEPELALLNGELHVLHVAIVLLELVLDAVELLVDLGHSFLHRGILGSTLCLADTGALCPTL